MNNEEIKKECEMLYAQIKQANERLRELRKICPHEETFIGYYAHERPPNISTEKICSCCNQIILDKERSSAYSSFVSTPKQPTDPTMYIPLTNDKKNKP